MTDRKMLEMAAKAAGMHANEWADVGDLLPDKGGWVQFVGHGLVSIWNPLTDDGDALRLAVRLGIEPRQTPEMSIALWTTDTPPGFAVRNEMHNGDPYAAMRLAITRAAAAIGQAQQGDING